MVAVPPIVAQRLWGAPPFSLFQVLLRLRSVLLRGWLYVRFARDPLLAPEELALLLPLFIKKMLLSQRDLQGVFPEMLVSRWR